MQCYHSTFYFTFNVFHHTVIMHIMVLWLWYLLWLCNSKLQNEILAWLMPIHTLKSGNSKIIAPTTVSISYIPHIHESLYLKEKTLSRKYLQFLKSFHSKTLSVYFRMWQDCRVQIGRWRFFCFLHADNWYWEWRETEGRTTEKCKTQWLAFYPKIHAFHSLSCFQALTGVHYLQTKFWHMGNLAWSNNAYVPWRLSSQGQWIYIIVTLYSSSNCLENTWEEVLCLKKDMEPGYSFHVDRMQQWKQ